MEEFVMEELFKSVDSTLDSSSSDETETPRHVGVRINDYMKVIDAYSDKQFKEHFRLNRKTIENLIDIYAQTIPAFKGGWPIISAKKSIYMSVWYLANTESFRQIADRFNVTNSSAHRVIKSVVQYFVDISENYIKWPNQEEAEQEEQNFSKMKGLHHIIAAIDGSHLRIPRPSENEDDYVNRKGYHSILLQGIVNSKKMFINIKAGEPGSMHDARMLRRSQIYELAEENYEEVFSGKYCLVGDSAYPSLRWLVTPFKDNGHLTEQEREYNYKHSATRMVIEHAFGLLKGRFRRIRAFENRDQSFIINCTVVACVVHNICISSDDIFNEEFHDDIDEESSN